MKSILLIIFCLFTTLTIGSEVKEISFLWGKVDVMEGKEKLSAKIIVSKQKDVFLLKLLPEGLKDSCVFKIRKITSPQQTKGMRGHILTLGKFCKWKKYKKENLLNKFWSKVLSIDLFYFFKKSGDIGGHVKIATSGKIVHGKISYLKFKK